LFEGENGEAGEYGETPAEAAGRYMVDEYRQFPTRNGTQRALHRVVTLLGEGRAVLTHCFAGKDRTGFVIATVLEMVGLDQDAIVADYLRSNDSVPVLRERITESLSQRSDIEVTPEILKFTEARLSDEVLGVRPEYLDSSRRTIDEMYGSLDSYLRDAGITATHIDQLRSALLF
jgi:protein-tyrosine phosphatase